MRYKHVVWDFDGTLFDTYPVIANAYAAVLQDAGIPISADSLQSLTQISFRHAWQYLAETYGVDDALKEQCKTQAKAVQAELAQPFPGAVALCRTIHERGGSNYLCTHRGNSAYFFLDKFGLSPYFTELVTSENGFERKPSPQSVLYLIQKYAIPPKEAVIIGDRDLDILAGYHAGIDGCFFTGSGNTPGIATPQVADFDALYAVLGLEKL